MVLGDGYFLVSEVPVYPNCSRLNGPWQARPGLGFPSPTEPWLLLTIDANLFGVRLGPQLVENQPVSRLRFSPYTELQRHLGNDPSVDHR